MRKSVLWGAVLSLAVMTSACQGQEGGLPQKLVIPESFPADLPLYPGARLESVQKVKSGSAVWASDTIILSSDDDIAEVVGYYQRDLTARGWSAMAKTAVDDQVTTSYKKDRRVMVIGASRGKERTLISIAHLVE